MHHAATFRAPAVAALAAIAVSSGAAAAPQWAPIAELPGGARVAEAKRPAGDAGRVREVRWAPDGSAAWSAAGSRLRAIVTARSRALSSGRKRS